MLVRGRIVEEQKNYYQVDTKKDCIRSVLKGVLKKEHKRLYIGDIVTIEMYNTDIPEGIIRELHPRKNTLYKPSVANIDQVIFIVTLKQPPLDYTFTDCFLFTMSVSEFPVRIVFNKSDLLTEKEKVFLADLITHYEKLDYSCLQTSALTGDHIDCLIEKCRDSLSILAGPSGTGKSTILAKIFPDHMFRVGELSQRVSRGVHTTTHTTLLALPQGGYIADTPGFSHMQLPQIDENDVIAYFPEIAALQSACRFNNCIHENEPGCAVKEKVDRGDILHSRYASYLYLYHAMQQKRREFRES